MGQRLLIRARLQQRKGSAICRFNRDAHVARNSSKFLTAENGLKHESVCPFAGNREFLNGFLHFVTSRLQALDGWVRDRQDGLMAIRLTTYGFRFGDDLFSQP